MTARIYRSAGYADIAAARLPLAVIAAALPAEWDGYAEIDLSETRCIGRADGGKWGALDGDISAIHHAVMSLPDVLDAHRAQATARIMAAAREFRFGVAGTRDEVEIASWSEKVRLAEAFLADPENAPAVAVAAIEGEAALRGLGETAAELAAKQVANGALFRPLAARIDGERKAALASIAAAATVDEISAVLAGFESALAALLEAA